MKKYSGNLLYRGRAFDFRVCAKTHKEACEILDVPLHHLQKYISHFKTDKPFEGYLVTAYGSRSIDVIGHNREITFEEFKRLVDEKADEISKSWK